MMASLNNLPGRVALGLKVWEKGISSFMTSQALATAKNKWLKPSRSSNAYSIISFYTALYKKGTVSWRWLLERLASPTDFEIHYGSGKLPKVSLKEADKVVKAIQDKEDPTFVVSADIDREATVEMHYIKQTEFVLRNRIQRIATLLVSDEFSSAMVGCFNKQLFAFDQSEGYQDESHVKDIATARVGFIVKTFLQELILDPYYDKLQELLAIDVNQLHLHELFDLYDRFENLRRDCEIGVRCEVKREVPVSSELYVLRKISDISQVPKNWVYRQDPMR